MDSVQSLGKCMAEILKREGLQGLYKGALPSVLKAAPSAAVTFAAYSYILQMLAGQPEAKGKMTQAVKT